MTNDKIYALVREEPVEDDHNCIIFSSSSLEKLFLQDFRTQNKANYKHDW